MNIYFGKWKVKARLGNILMLVLLLSGTTASMGQEAGNCGSLDNHFGPFDYRTERGEPKRLVEGAHFPPVVENLIRGHRGYLGGDIDYTLRAFPNHHRALLSMMNYSFRSGQETPPNARYSIACYFDRAMRFRPDDGAVRMLFGFYLLKKGKTAEAISELNKARELTGEDPNLNYNLGLAYFKVKDYDSALKYAHRAYDAGFPLPGLRKMLTEAGQWKDPPPPEIGPVAAPAQTNGSEVPLAGTDGDAKPAAEVPVSEPELPPATKGGDAGRAAEMPQEAVGSAKSE